MARLTLAVAALVLISGCAGVQRLGAQSSPAADVIPWLPLPVSNASPPPEPSPQPAPLPPGTPACGAAQLVGVALGGGGATGHLIVAIAFSDKGPGQCYLDGTPSVMLYDSAGVRLPFRQLPPFMPSRLPGPALLLPGPAPEPHNALKLGQAGFTIDWVTQPEACPGEKPVLVSTARVAIPAGGTLAVNIPELPAAYLCAGLGVGAFEAPPVPVDTGPPPPMLAIALQAPGSIRAGQRLDYRVTLTNKGTNPIDLAATCPNYEEELFADIVHGSPPLGGKHFYQLNCAPAGRLQPGSSATFQMIYDVPADAPPGVYTLIFQTQYWSWPSPSAQASVTLTR